VLAAALAAAELHPRVLAFAAPAGDGSSGDATPAAAAAGDPALPGVKQVDAELTARLHAALQAKGATYRPRTRHLEQGGVPKYTNRLILESSPYLIQHAHNPVNWYAWGDEPFDRARREGKPVFLSVGYSTCHWCHVMERESFEDEEIAKILNERFIAIKVDREERPDIDDVYMRAVQIMRGNGGWPMTLLLTADRDAFFGATYIPPRDDERTGTGLLSLLPQLLAVYDRDPATIVSRARELSERMRASARVDAAPGIPRGEAVFAAASQLARSFDAQHGGFGAAPKFPQPSAHELLLRYYRRTNDPQALRIVTTTLDHMAAGGIYDQVGGGFHRYSTDRTWLTPHFEKMLYDNAQLAALYLDAWQITQEDELARVARETLDYLAREMSSPDGGFYSATDADSPAPNGHEEEGWFFTWTAADVEAVLGAERARLVYAYYGVTDVGNFEGRNILHVTRPLADVAGELGVTPEDARSQLEAARKLLYDARAKRPPPLRDEKILVSWNALAISAFARAGFAFERPDYLARARAAADFILQRIRDSKGRLHHSFKGSPASELGYLDDYAFFIQALLDLYEATSELRWLDTALAVQRTLDESYYDDEAGGYFMSGADNEALLVRQKPAFDWAEPAGNSIAVLNLLRLCELTTRDEFRARAEGTLRAFAGMLGSGSPGTPKLLSALDFYLDEPIEVVVGGVAADDPGRAALMRVARTTYFPNRMFAAVAASGDLEQQAALVPVLEGKRALADRATAYVCKKRQCDLPTSDPEKFQRQLLSVKALWEQGEPPPLPVVAANSSP
jgi:uncharacterized protein YyaL (SSP411 family)